MLCKWLSDLSLDILLEVGAAEFLDVLQQVLNGRVYAQKNAIMFFLILLVNHAAGADEVVAAPYQAFPNGYGYMEKVEISALTVADSSGMQAIVRSVVR